MIYNSNSYNIYRDSTNMLTIWDKAFGLWEM
jgi:hypothetical protein